MILDGELNLVEVYDGELGLFEIFDGEAGEYQAIGNIPSFDGPYEVIPTVVEQTFETAGRKMTENFVVSPIPQNYGLITWDGSTLTVS